MMMMIMMMMMMMMMMIMHNAKLINIFIDKFQMNVRNAQYMSYYVISIDIYAIKLFLSNNLFQSHYRVHIHFNFTFI